MSEGRRTLVDVLGEDKGERRALARGSSYAQVMIGALG